MAKEKLVSLKEVCVNSISRGRDCFSGLNDGWTKSHSSTARPVEHFDPACTSQRGLIIFAALWLGGLGFEAGSDQDFNLYLLLSRVATAHTGGRARGGYPLGVGEGGRGGREGLKGKAGSKAGQKEKEKT